jgi:hypothetical protein
VPRIWKHSWIGGSLTDKQPLESVVERLPAGMLSGAKTFGEPENQVILLETVRGSQISDLISYRLGIA